MNPLEKSKVIQYSGMTCSSCNADSAGQHCYQNSSLHGSSKIYLVADLDLLQSLSSEEGDSPFYVYIANASIKLIGVTKYENSLACRVHVPANSLANIIV